MNVPHQPNEEQSALWNGPAGDAWVELQEILDGMMKPVEDLLVEIVSSDTSRGVLDVGCGKCTTTLAMARALGTRGECTGIDISAPMIGAAMSRAEREGVPALQHILEESGWAEIDIKPLDVACSLPAKALAHVARFGPLGRLLQDSDEATRTRVINAVRAAFEQYVHGDEVRFTAAVWLIGARGSSARTAPEETMR